MTKQGMMGRVVVTAAAVGVMAMAAYGVRADAGFDTAAQADRVKRGEYLVNAVGGCNDCHTPMKLGPNGPEPDMTKFLSGHQADEKLPPPPAASGPWIATVSASGTAWSGPWGISYTQNLTPDMETGLGNYTEDQFLMTIRVGKKQGRGRALLPPMPWMVYGKMTDEDLKSIYAYLRTIKPLRNRVPDPVIAEIK
jgi:mono/diheme cytochrome c family protein